MYRVEVSREGKFWYIHIPKIDRSTQARRYSEIEEMARDLIEVMTGDTDPPLSIDVVLPEAAARHLGEANRLRAESDRAKRKAAEEHRLAVRALIDSGIPQSDVSRALGLSKQRVSQLASRSHTRAVSASVEHDPDSG